jgi:polyferredoxin
MSIHSSITPGRAGLAVQSCFAAYCFWVGFRFMAFLNWAAGQSAEYAARPGAVEGFLPISAVLGLRQLVSTGRWDMVHPAGLTIFIAVMVMALVLRKGFCGYVCPVGLLSGLLDRAGRRLGLSRVPPRWVDYPLMTFKYLLLGFFLYTVFFGMDLRAVQSFLTAPYNLTADARMLRFFLEPSGLALAVLLALVVLSVVLRNVWCRYLCPYGALLGVLAWMGPTAVVRDAESCIDCGRCTRGCPGGIQVHRKDAVRSPECIGCAECVGNCPVPGCLSVRMAGRRVPWLAIGLGAVAVLLGFWLWAEATGHWDAQTPPAMLRRLYAMALGAV